MYWYCEEKILMLITLGTWRGYEIDCTTTNLSSTLINCTSPITSIGAGWLHLFFLFPFHNIFFNLMTKRMNWFYATLQNTINLFPSLGKPNYPCTFFRNVSNSCLLNYSGTLLIRSPKGQKTLAVLTGACTNEVFLQENVWPFYQAAKKSGCNQEVNILIRWP